MVAVCVLMALSQHTQLARALCFVAAGGFIVFAASGAYGAVKRGASSTRGDKNGLRRGVAAFCNTAPNISFKADGFAAA